MQILIYKRTHMGDPDASGQFGINDCMGSIRNWHFDAVIGVGGTSSEPQSYGIAGRVNWVGRNPTWRDNPLGRGQIVTFESFKLFEHTGPLLSSLAPCLARRLYEKRARFLLKTYSKEEQAEAETLVTTLLSNAFPDLKLSPDNRETLKKQMPICKGAAKSKCTPSSNCN
ncbi:hypothetical protein M5G22_24720 [Pseudomonas sp. TNT2022 ID233]|uniref:hypothetical protein n=1 Tax=Pseudomonas aphyarum TaxID=2942629 RepID=UPI00235F076F|nr:hypothetical protein [Pseudomonas aphyarum]MDD1140778.1 hypothetical protein [Pseudomonas aphyarum]